MTKEEEEMVQISGIDVSLVLNRDLEVGQVVMDTRVDEASRSVHLTISLSDPDPSYLQMMAEIAFEPGLKAVLAAADREEEEEEDD